MVLVVASDHPPKPCTDLTDTIMLPAEKLNLDGLQLRHHSLFRRNPPDGEGIGLMASPAVVGEAQEREGPRFPFSAPLSVCGLHSARTRSAGSFPGGVPSRTRQPFLKIFKEPHCFGSMLEAHHKIVG
jgi:hypothetical protein